MPHHQEALRSWGIGEARERQPLQSTAAVPKHQALGRSGLRAVWQSGCGQAAATAEGAAWRVCVRESCVLCVSHLTVCAGYLQ